MTNIDFSEIVEPPEMMMDLDRPLAVLDCEATGVDPKEARLIQVAIRVFDPTEVGIALCDPFIAYVKGVDIPPRVQELTGITPEILDRHGSALTWVMEEVAVMLQGADLAGYNIVSYDWPLLEQEFFRTGVAVPGPDQRTILDAFQLEKQLTPMTLEAVYERRIGREMANAHDARGDVDGTLSILLDQAREVDGDTTPEGLADRARGPYLSDLRKLKRREDGTVEIAFGNEHYGEPLAQVQAKDPGYVDWMRREVDGLAAVIDGALRDDSTEDDTLAP